jgi:anthranilate phosphoribosyltransferase
VGVTFLFARGGHPAMKAVAPLRSTLKVRTVFNLLGPLVNPLQPTGQVIGVYDVAVVPAMAEALNQLGIPQAIVLHGRERLDEAGLGDKTDISVVENGQVTSAVIDPQALGLAAVSQRPTTAATWRKLWRYDGHSPGQGTQPAGCGALMRPALKVGEKVSGKSLKRHNRGRYSWRKTFFASGCCLGKLQLGCRSSRRVPVRTLTR